MGSLFTHLVRQGNPMQIVFKLETLLGVVSC